jgi:galactokinase
MELQALRKEFEARFARAPAAAVQAPGRVNLIGEHTDYNDGYVLPIAIERRTVALVAPREDREIHFSSMQADQDAAIDLDKLIAPGRPAWANYCKGVAAGLFLRGTKLVGADLLFDSDVPLGGGLSSSASLEVATAYALLAACGGAVDDAELATLCQKAEHEFADAPCGIMDQSVAIMARAGRALLLDCRSRETRHIPFDDPGVVLLVVDTEVKHDIAEGRYAERRRQCEEAAEILSLPALRDADMDTIIAAEADSRLLAGDVLKRARHVVSENERTLRAVEALEAGDYRRFGKLMQASHASLRDDYEVSCEELDAVVELAGGCEGVYGARMTGGGFGGCAIVLADAGRGEAVAQRVGEGFRRRFGHRCPIFATHAAAGAGPIA